MYLTELLQIVSNESEIDIDTTRKVYEAFIDALVDKLMDGYRIGLTGFGTFYLQRHKGHPVQFDDKKTAIDDYNVMKFSASGLIKRRLNKKNRCN